MLKPIAILGSATTHGGTITRVASTITCENVVIACVGDEHTCPIPYHGKTLILDGVPGVLVQGKPIARVGSKIGCGAVITTGSPTATVKE